MYNSNYLFNCILIPSLNTSCSYLKYLKVTIIYGYIQILADFENSGFTGINFSDFTITCSINSKMCDKILILVGTIFSENGAVC